MKPRDFAPDELKNVRSALVPFARADGSIRADECGRLWKKHRQTGEWVQLGVGPDVKIALYPPEMNGFRLQVLAFKAVAMAWHGPRPKHWCVRFRDGDRENLKPSNLEWCEKRTGRPRKLSRWEQLEALERAEDGETLTDLAEEYGVTVGTMTHLCKDYVPRGASVAATRKRTPEERAAAVAERLAGRKSAAVAMRHKMSESWVNLMVRRVKRATQPGEQPCSQSAST